MKQEIYCKKCGSLLKEYEVIKEYDKHTGKKILNKIKYCSTPGCGDVCRLNGHKWKRTYGGFSFLIPGSDDEYCVICGETQGQGKYD